MGTNFYIRDADGSEGDHIGKRSAAGWYCWDCDRSLCIDGEDYVHYDNEFAKSCPVCNKPVVMESLNNGAVARELGFDKSPHGRKTGVASCSSFRWALKPNQLQHRIRRQYPVDDAGLVIMDEYGHEFTWAEFQAILEECPIQFYDMIGKEFS